MEANLGSTVTMSCPAKGIPNSITYVWKKNDQMIEGETGSELTIDRMTVAGSGVYQCIPYNVHGNHNSTSIQVIVKGKHYIHVLAFSYTVNWVYFVDY